MSNENSLYILISEGPNKTWIRKDAGPITRWLKRPSKIYKSKRWLSENLAPGRWIAEQVSPEYSQQMDVLREVHDQVENWTKDLSNALDRAQDARKLGKPLDSIFWLGQINNRLKLVADEKEKLQDIQERHLEKYFEEHEETIPEDYFETGKHRIVEAGVLDDLGRQLATWKFQKAHKNRLKEQDVALKKLLSLAKSVVGRTYSLLKDMSSALGNGDISHYLQALEKVSKQQSNFESEFRAIYNEHFAAMATRIKAKRKEEAEQAARFKEEAERREQERLQGEGLVSTPPTETTVLAPEPNLETTPESLDVPVSFESSEETILPVEKTPPVRPPFIFEEDPAQRELIWKKKLQYKGKPEGDLPETLPMPELPPETVRSELPQAAPKKLPGGKGTAKKSEFNLDNMILKMNHVKFQQELNKAASTGADPYLLAAMMLKYSESIDEIDPEKSLELLSIAEGIFNV